MNQARKFKISLTITLFTFVFGVSAWIFYNSSVFQEPELEIPNANWEKIFFEGINAITDSTGLEKLREKNLSKNDTEIRVWRGFGLEPLEGMLFKQIDNRWTVYYVSQDKKYDSIKAETIQLLRKPKSGWKSFTDQIFDEGILELPDSEKIGCDVDTLDGQSYVVEIYKNKIYRTYRYDSASETKCPEGKKMNNIAEIIAKEFDNGIQKCLRAEWLPCLSRDSE